MKAVLYAQPRVFTVEDIGATDPGPTDVQIRVHQTGQIEGSFAEIASFPAARAALRSGRVRTEGPITHRCSLDGYGRALDDFSNDTSLHKAVVSPLV